MDVEQFVNVLEILHREGDTLVPNIEVLSVAGLQLDQFLAARFPDLRIACRSLVRLLVNANDLGERIACECLSIQQIFPSPYHHPELRPPVADMIVANNFVTEKACDARQCVPEHYAADMTDVHRLSHIG